MQLREKKWKQKCEKMTRAVDTTELSSRPFSFCQLFLMLKENQEMKTLGTNIYGNNNIKKCRCHWKTYGTVSALKKVKTS